MNTNEYKNDKLRGIQGAIDDGKFLRRAGNPQSFYFQENYHGNQVGLVLGLDGGSPREGTQQRGSNLIEK